MEFRQKTINYDTAYQSLTIDDLRWDIMQLK